MPEPVISTDVFEALGIVPNPETVDKRVRLRLTVLLADQIRRRGWTEAKAAEALGINEVRVGQLLRGRFERFSTGRLIVLLAILDVRVDQLLERGLMATMEESRGAG